MQQLNPLNVPWQVSPSTPFLRLLAVEPGDDQPTQIVFVAYFGREADWARGQEMGFAAVSQPVNPHSVQSIAQQQSKTDRIVKVEFENACCARFCPAFSDREILDPKNFDFSAIPYSDIDVDVGSWLRNFQSLWLKTGNCPDPRAYVVESSLWIERLGLNGFQHFLFQGHDAYAEVIARAWAWTEVRKLSGSW